MEESGGTRRRLIDVTRGMIDADGVGAVSMRHLGAAMGLSRGAVYRHFGSKDDLLAAIATEDFTWLTNSLAALEEKARDPRRLAREMLSTFYDFATQHHERFRLMFIMPWARDREALHAAARALFAQVYRTVERAVAQSALNRSPRELTAMSAAFVTGLAELVRAGHVEQEKGFDDSYGLIEAFVDANFI